MGYPAGVRHRLTVVGSLSSGTRLVTRLLNASPHIEAIHDVTHGARPGRWPVVYVTRDETARRASVAARWPDGHDRTASPVYAVATVAYEDVVADPHAVIGTLAAVLEVPVWTFSEAVYDANSETGTRCGRLPSFS